MRACDQTRESVFGGCLERLLDKIPNAELTFGVTYVKAFINLSGDASGLGLVWQGAAGGCHPGADPFMVGNLH
jgi:hypothetical protein